MSDLTPRDREMVALGAAMGSNCAPCIEHHIPESRKAGLSDTEIHAAILHADTIRQVPARKTLNVALSLLPAAAAEVRSAGPDTCCGSGAAGTAHAGDGMLGMMTKMMDTCGGRAQPFGANHSAEQAPAAKPASSEACSCG